MTLTPIASNTSSRKLESGEPNSATTLNIPAQAFLNQSLAISVELEAIAAIQSTTSQKLALLNDAISLRGGAIGLISTLQSERSQSSTADNQASTIEAGIAPLASATLIERDRVTPLNTKLNGVTTATYQAFSNNLSAIASASVSANNYLYRNPEAIVSYATPLLSSGTRMRDTILQATLAAGASSPTIPNQSEWELPLTTTLNMAPDFVSWNPTTKELTLGAGIYSIDGYAIATNSQLVQMVLLQGTTRYLGTAGKGTGDSGVVGGDRLTTYSHLLTSFSISSARVYKCLLYLNGGAIVASSMSEATPYAFLRVRQYQS